VSQELIQGYRLSPPQKSLWQQYEFDQHRPQFVRCLIEISGQMDEATLERAVSEVVRQHEILRTSFQMLPGMTIPVQVISETAALTFRKSDLTRLSEAEQQARVRERFEDPKWEFNYSESPLFTGELFRVAEQSRLLLLTAPALCADEASLALLFSQIVRAYLKPGESSDAAETMQYADFAEWQNELLESADAAIARQHWSRVSAGETNQRLPLEQQISANRLTNAIEFPPELITKVQSAAANNNLDVSSLLLAAWQTMLLRSTTWQDVTIAVAVSGRDFPELKSAIGTIESYVPILLQRQDACSFNELLARVEHEVREARRLQPFFSTEEQQASRFPWAFASRELPDDIVRGDLRFSFVRQRAFNQPFKLKLTSEARADQLLRAGIEYDKSLFSAEAIELLIERLSAIVADVTRDPRKDIADLESVGEREQNRLKEFAGESAVTSAVQSTSECLHELFAAQAAKTPDATALVYERTDLTFKQLNERSNRVAHRLQKMGVGPDVPVGLCLDRSLELIVGLFGILKAGGAYVPLDPGLPLERLHGMLDDVGADIVVTRRGLIAGAAGFKKTLYLDLTATEDDEAMSSNPVSAATGANLAYIIFTSGSTGKPKGVGIEHRQITSYLNAVGERLDLSPQSSYATVSTIAADLGNTVLYPPLLNGGCLHLISEERASNPDSFAEYCRQNRIDCLKIVPSHLLALLSAAEPADLLPRRRLILGGEASGWTLVKKISELAPKCRVLNHYGPTEATVGAATYDVQEPYANSDTVPLGRPLNNARTYILNEKLELVPIGVPGELFIGGAGVARGYIERAAATAERFVPNPFAITPGERWYRTGDLARYQLDGRLEFLGRSDDQVKIHGYRIEPGEVAAVLQTNPSVARAFVMAREDQPGDKRLVAYVVSADHSTTDAAALKTFLQGKLPEYMLPKSLVFLQSLPLTPNGKLDKKALPAPDAVHGPSKNRVAPRNQIETTLAKIWGGVLGIEEPGVHDNFFELGGDSILSIQIIARANQAGLKLSPRQIFQHQTIAELAEVTGTVETVVGEQGIVTGSVPLTPVQARFFSQQQAAPHYYNQAMLLNLEERIEVAVLEEALAKLLAHHDALRLRFEPSANGWRQFNDEVKAPQVLLFDINELEEQSARLQASLDLQNGPLLRFALFRANEEDANKLLIVIHHLAVDGVSWRLLLEDLQTLCSDLRTDLPAKTTSFKRWAEQLSAHAKSDELHAEFPYWRDLMKSPVASLPVDSDGGKNTAASAATVTVSLSPRETLALLMESPAAYRTQINEVLVTALADAVAEWTGDSNVLLDIEGHGREDIFPNIDLSRTVGWFTTIFPVVLDLQETQGIVNRLRVVKERLREVPNRGLGYGLLRYLSGNKEIVDTLNSQPQAQVRFNYLGQTDRAAASHLLFKPAAESTGPTQSPNTERHYLLNVIGAVTGGQLRFEWTYSANIHRRETIEQLAASYAARLRNLIVSARNADATTLSPSDFPSAKLSREDLSKVLAKLRG
jgi:amino acid adenylation domain-containing protein/non-ribosomal peptide synthase protein (TIGR01720 family)